MFNKITFSMLFILSGLVFADVENAENVVSEKDTNHYTFSVGYSGLGLNIFSVIHRYHRNDQNNFLWSFGPGLGLVEKGFFAAAADLQAGMLLPNIPNSAITIGINPRMSLDEFEFITYIGFIYKQWLLNLGYSIGSNDNLSLNVGYSFESIKEKKIVEKNIEEKKEEKSAENSEKPEKNSTRYFRPGIEFNYPIYRSKIEFFDNSFPYLAGGAGLFLRMGPEYFYFTTGVYAKEDVLYKEGIASAEFKILGINLVSVPLLDLEWDRVFVEVPLLLNFGSGQIRFTGGVLLDFYAASNVSVKVNKNVPILGGQNLISASDAEKIEDRFNEIPEGDLYVVFGLDIDIVRHWGIGVKCSIWGGDWWPDNVIDANMGIEPSRFQTRISTYFVF
jgi:hypothetical protein